MDRFEPQIDTDRHRRGDYHKKGWGGKLPALTFLIIIGEMLAYITEMS